MNSAKELVGRYRELINSNADIVTGLEGVLKSALYILPSQLGGDAEVHSEAAYSVVSVLSLLHDLIFMGQLRKKITALQTLRRAVSSRSNSQKRTSFSTEPNPLNKQLQMLQPKWWLEGGTTLLTVASSVELFLEMWAANSPSSNAPSKTAETTSTSTFKFNENKRWAYIFFIELFKVFVKLYMLLKARGSILVMQALPDRSEVRDQIQQVEKEINQLNKQIEQAEADPSFSESLPKEPRFTLMDHARRQSKIADSGLVSWENFWKAQQPTQIVTAYIPSRPNIYQTIGELIHILRPLIYVMLIINCGKRSWRPWIVSLIVEFISVRLSSSSTKPLNQSEMEELKRRKQLFLYYLIRAPFYENVLINLLTRLPLASFFYKFKWVKKITDMGSEMIEGYRDYYFYLSGSSA